MLRKHFNSQITHPNLLGCTARRGNVRVLCKEYETIFDAVFTDQINISSCNAILIQFLCWQIVMSDNEMKAT